MDSGPITLDDAGSDLTNAAISIVRREGRFDHPPSANGTTPPGRRRSSTPSWTRRPAERRVPPSPFPGARRQRGQPHPKPTRGVRVLPRKPRRTNQDFEHACTAYRVYDESLVSAP